MASRYASTENKSFTTFEDPICVQQREDEHNTNSYRIWDCLCIFEIEYGASDDCSTKVSDKKDSVDCLMEGSETRDHSTSDDDSTSDEDWKVDSEIRDATADDENVGHRITRRMSKDYGVSIFHADSSTEQSKQKRRRYLVKSWATKNHVGAKRTRIERSNTPRYAKISKDGNGINTGRLIGLSEEEINRKFQSFLSNMQDWDMRPEGHVSSVQPRDKRKRRDRPHKATEPNPWYYHFLR